MEVFLTVFGACFGLALSVALLFVVYDKVEERCGEGWAAIAGSLVLSFIVAASASFGP